MERAENVFEDVYTETTRIERTFGISRSSSGHSIGQLKCKVKNDDVKVNWLKNESLLQNEEKYNIIENGKERILVINNVGPEDEGEYICQSGKYRVVLYLTLKEDELELYDNDQNNAYISSANELRDKNIRIDEKKRRAELRCVVPEEGMKVEWLKGLRLISKNEKYDMKANGRERLLVINNLEKQDSDDYTCESGKFKTVLHLSVNSNVNTTDESDDSVFGSRTNLSQLDLTFDEKDNARLKCKLKKPSENLVWLKDGQKIWGSNPSLDQLEKYKVLQEDQSRVLVIKNLTRNDTGKYVCQSKRNPKHRVEFTIHIKGNLIYINKLF